jgi:hypothetical protein
MMCDLADFELASLPKLSAPAFGFVLGFARRYCLPLHVARGVGSAAFQRFDMIDHITGAPTARPSGGRARMLALKGMLGGG